ncbi:hypothetical protein GCM10027040_30700 [Halomonas shantousis]
MTTRLAPLAVQDNMVAAVQLLRTVDFQQAQWLDADLAECPLRARWQPPPTGTERQ